MSTSSVSIYFDTQQITGPIVGSYKMVVYRNDFGDPISNQGVLRITNEYSIETRGVLVTIEDPLEFNLLGFCFTRPDERFVYSFVEAKDLEPGASFQTGSIISYTVKREPSRVELLKEADLSRLSFSRISLNDQMSTRFISHNSFQATAADTAALTPSLLQAMEFLQHPLALEAPKEPMRFKTSKKKSDCAIL